MSSVPPPSVIEINSGGSSTNTNMSRWLKIIGICIGAYVVIGLLAAGTTKPQWLGNMNDVLNKSTSMASWLLSNWYLVPIGYLVLLALPAGEKWIAEKTAKTVKDGKAEGKSDAVIKAAAEKVAATGLEDKAEKSGAAEDATKAAAGKEAAEAARDALDKEEDKQDADALAEKGMAD